MIRWSQHNMLLGISHSQFTKLVTEFHAAAEASFGTTCSLSIAVLKEPKVYTTFVDHDISSNLDGINSANTILQTDRLGDITARLWRQAGYVEVTIRPTNAGQAPAHAFAHAEFKGLRPKQATFYLQPDGEAARATMMGHSPKMLFGDGFTSNGRRSDAIPASLMGFGFA